MQKKLLEKYLIAIKYIPLLKWKYITIIGFLTIGLFILDLHNWYNKHFLSASIKQALITAAANHSFSQLENKTSYPLTAKNNSRDSYFSEKSPFIQMTDASAANDSLPNSLPEELSNTLPNNSSKTPKSAIDEFPADLPHSVDNEQEQTEHFSTPEYVIIRSSDQATFSSETTAHVALLTIEEGSYFKMGDILLQLDCREQQAELKKAKAQQQATHEAEKSASKLQSYGSISETELIKAQTDATMANADVERLKAVVDKCTIKAPFNGAVSELMVHAHETVKPGDPLLKIVSTENLELQMQVPSNWLQWIHIGTQFNVHVSEIDQSIVAKVIKINPQIDSVSQTVKIIGIIINHNPNLLPGMSGQALFPDNPDLKHQE
jgi:membrane fusion protein (multidrug efflux system)